MARKPRFCPGGLAYHVMNRTWGSIDLFEDSADYAAFERVLAEALEVREKTMRLCAYCLMPNHFHLVLWPTKDGQLSRFMQWVTMTHAQRWHAHRHTAGRGHLYQSRFKSFPIQQDAHFLKVCRYVEQNAFKAGLCPSAEGWRWGSAALRENESADNPIHTEENPPALTGLMSPWPVDRPRNWTKRLNERPDERELLDLRACRDRGRPYGETGWVTSTAKRLEIESSLRPPGRPKTKENEKKGF